MLDFCHGRESRGTCRLFKVGKNTLKNVGEEGVVASKLFNANTIIFTLYCFSNKSWSNDDWEPKDIRLNFKSILADFLNGCIRLELFGENRVNGSIEHVKVVVPSLKRDSSLKIKPLILQFFKDNKLVIKGELEVSVTNESFGSHVWGLGLAKLKEKTKVFREGLKRHERIWGVNNGYDV